MTTSTIHPARACRAAFAARAAILLLAWPAAALAQSVPDRTVAEAALFRAFPEADAYSCIRRDVDQAARIAIEQRLPFKVHFNELGEHELLVAFRGRRPVGLVYLRTEEAEWGLVDIAWHLTLDLRLLDFEYVRGRNRHQRALEQSPLARDLNGANFDAVTTLLARRTDAGQLQRKEGADALAVTTLRSAAKTLAVVEIVWAEEIEKLHDQATGYDLFPAAARFTRRSGAFDLDSGRGQQRVAVKVIYAYDLGDTLLGCVIWTESAAGGEPLAIRWVVDRELRVIKALPSPEARNVALRAACTSLDGQLLTAPTGADERLVPLARGIGTVVQRLMARRPAR